MGKKKKKKYLDKETINEDRKRKNEIVKRGQIYYVDLGVGEGSELKKIRPCVVIQNDIGNKYSPTTIVAPITHRTSNRNQPTQIVLDEYMQNKFPELIDGVIMAEQIRVVSKTRFKEFAGELLPGAIKLLDKAMKISLGVK